MQLNGSLMLMHALKNEGVKVVFGYPGGAALNIYDEIYKQDFFKHILVRHEQAAVHAADGYARASGEVGVAIVTSGPGFTNAVTGIATAYMDSIPLVIISGQVPTSLIGTDAFQEIDAVGISRPCTKHNYLVKDIQSLPRILKEAFFIARSGRPGPVHIDLPKDISATIGEFNYPQNISLETYKPTYKGNTRQIQKAATAIKESKKPLLYIGGGSVASNARDSILKLCEITKIPAIETLMARGVLRYDCENLLGMVGMHGSYVANMAMSEADLLIALGARFDDRVTGKLSEFAKGAQIIHIDIDPSSISKIVQVDYPIVGDVCNVVDEIAELLDGDYDCEIHRPWRDSLEKYNTLHPLNFKDSNEVLKPQWVIQKVGEIVRGNAFVSTDVGQHQMWCAQFYPFSSPREFITSGGLGTMGFGLPAAMGAKCAYPNKISINISGDGSILMNIQELLTCVAENIPVINIVLNNNYLGMVRQWQSFFYDERFSNTNLEIQPDFVKLVESFGGVGYVCEDKDSFEKALKDAISQNKVALLDVRIDRMENVLPMVPTGGALFNMILESKE